MSKLLDLVKSSLRRVVVNAEEDILDIEKIDANLTPNMRALRLAVSVADQLSSMGVAASDVVHMALGITDTYCTRKVHIDISYTLVSISQDRGVDREPLTMIRTIVPRYTNYQTIQRLQELAKNIRSKKCTLEQAENELNDTLEKPQKYPAIVTYLAGGGLSAGVSVLYTGSLAIIFISFIVGTIVSWLIAWLAKQSLPTFFIQALAAFLVTAASVLLTWAVASGYLEFISYINPTLIIIGGIVLLVAGMMIVGAFQDAIDEYYLTASARILKVVMMTGGIVMGVVIGLYIGKSMNVHLVASPDSLTLSSTTYQYIGAAIIASMFALGNHAKIRGVLLSGAIGVLGYYCSLLAINLGSDTVASYGIAAAVIGFTATMISRVWKVPSMATIAAGIVPLVPGLLLYNGLMHVVQSSPGTDDFTEGTAFLLRAFLIAISIAAGASFGNIIGRPMRRRLTNLQNRLPITKL